MGRQAEGPCPPWGSLGRQSSWQATLLAAAILSSCFLLTQAQEIRVTVEPSQPVEGQDVTLTPEGTLSFVTCVWYQGGQAESNRILSYLPSSGQQNGPHHTGRETGYANCSLSIRSLKLSDTGNYTVSKVTTLGATETGHALIKVLERVSYVTITSRPDKAIENELTVLNCSSAGSNVSYTWSKGDQKVESGGHITLGHSDLTFNSTSRNDTGNYTCTGHNSFSTSNATYWLDVFYGPDEPVISPPRQDYGEGSFLTLSCHAASHLSAQYTWYFNDTEVLETSSQLSILSLSFDQAGNYTCNASNPETNHTSSASQEINVLENVTDVSIQGPSETTENGSITLSCISRGSRVSYNWFKENQALENGSHISLLGLNHENLTLSPVSRSDAGYYTCYGNNSISGNSSEPFLVDVFYGPDDPIISPTEHDYVEGSDLNISCQADSNPVANYTWFFNETKEVGNSSQLLIPNLSFDKAGNYTCNATSAKTGVSKAAVWEVQVQEKLSSPTLWPAELVVKEHTNVTLNCTTSKSTTVLVFWFKDEKPTPAKSIFSERNRTLTIPDFSQDDEGTYRCQAWNPANSYLSNPSKIALDSTSSPGLSPGQIVGIVIGCLLGVALIAVVLYFALKSTTLGRTEQHAANGNIPSAPGHNQGVTDSKPTAGEEDIQYTTLAFNSNSPSQPGLGPTIPLENSTIYSVIKKK